jgi:Flp pilus assembly pilin Flp
MIRRFKQPFAFLWTNLYQDERGAAALTVFVIILAVSVVIVSTTALIGVDNLTIGFSQQVSTDMILSAESCVEEAMVRLSRNNSYAGGSLTVGDAQCTIAVTGTPCGACTIDVEAVGNAFTRNIRAGVTIAGSTVNITSWQERE